MTTRSMLFAATALLGLTAATAQAQEAISVTGGGESFAVTYAPGHTGNILGGGFAMLADQGQNTRIVYADPTIGWKANGLPVLLGGQEGAVVYLPAPAAPVAMADSLR